VVVISADPVACVQSSIFMVFHVISGCHVFPGNCWDFTCSMQLLGFSHVSSQFIFQMFSDSCCDVS
jgi:hypothetical protein